MTAATAFAEVAAAARSASIQRRRKALFTDRIKAAPTDPMASTWRQGVAEANRSLAVLGQQMPEEG